MFGTVRVPLDPQPEHIFSIGWRNPEGFGVFTGKLLKGEGWPLVGGELSDCLAEDGGFIQCPVQPATAQEALTKVDVKKIKGIWHWVYPKNIKVE